ncbi:(2Fe-2S)-binding protein [Halodesulfurarchaeum sp.]|uniref:(2Fe-2S)-binding protein n=1 Tax=Halodesulfurarchaeum sp. TaxID=1980530 RepID=UPI001BB85D22|nr:(2Fe-2S)-binding protein [Halodesulfurarchaeum sp.]
MVVDLTVNGDTVSIEEGQDLANGLRNAGYTEIKCGCDGGTCGISKIFLDGQLEMACGIDVVDAAGADVETVASLGTQSDLHPIQQAFVDHHAIQSGFSTGGFIMSAKALLQKNPDPTEAEVREAIDDVYCRETGYQKPVEAILDAAERMREEVAADGGTDPDSDAEMQAQGETHE